jgi:small subunit ribosomal protein S8
MMTDPISAMLVTIKNASAVKHDTVTIPYSKLKHAIADTLSSLGYVGKVEKAEKAGKPALSITLAYDKYGKSKVTDMKRYSKPGRREYKGVDEINKVREGYGAMILSTPEGILSDREARKRNVGGEALFTVW